MVRYSLGKHRIKVILHIAQLLQGYHKQDIRCDVDLGYFLEKSLYAQKKELDIIEKVLNNLDMYGTGE